LTAIRTKYGFYEFTLVPFGLNKTFAVFMNLVNDVFQDFLENFICVYLDDILVYSENPDDHLQHLRLTLDKLRANTLYVKRSKCQFAETTVDYLGHVISAPGVSMEDEQVNAIRTWNTTQSIDDVQSFLRVVNFYRRFIIKMAEVAVPLTRLTGNVDFEGIADAKASFQHLKMPETSAPVLRGFDERHHMSVSTDASGYASGAVLEQDDGQGRRPEAYFSQVLNIHQQRYSTRERELLALVQSVLYWRCYLYGRTSVVHTDHESLKYLRTQEELNERQVRFLELLYQFQFKINPVKGTANAVADALSRHPTNAPDKDISNQDLLSGVIAKTIGNHPKQPEVNSLMTTHLREQDLSTIQEEYRADLEFVTPAQEPVAPFTQDTGLLKRGERTCISARNLCSKLLHDYHDVPSRGHIGVRKTTKALATKYFWKTMQEDIQSY